MLPLLFKMTDIMRLSIGSLSSCISSGAIKFEILVMAVHYTVFEEITDQNTYLGRNDAPQVLDRWDSNPVIMN